MIAALQCIYTVSLPLSFPKASFLCFSAIHLRMDTHKPFASNHILTNDDDLYRANRQIELVAIFRMIYWFIVW